MSQIVNELATIELSNELLQQLDLDGVYQSFSKNYRKLDDLKNFREEYEKKNALMRWWHNDKLRDAQLDSAEIQAEFSKTIGQLMMISIIQSKKLSEQQTQLNDQQGELKTQADGIAVHAGKLQEQHHVLAEQSQKLEALVREYFELKGLTEEGAQKLIDIAREVKATKDGMLQEFELRSKTVEALCAGVQTRIQSVAAQMDARIFHSVEQSQAGIAGVQRETREALAANEARQKSQHMDLELRFSTRAEMFDKQLAANQEKLGSVDVAIKGLSVQTGELANALSDTKAGLVSSVRQQKNHQEEMALFQEKASRSIKRLRYVTVGLSMAVLGLLGGVAHIMKWI